VCHKRKTFFQEAPKMADIPVQLIVAAFNDETAADKALDALREFKKERAINILDAAIIKRDPDGKVHIKETADMGGGKGAVIGGVLGGVIGLIAGPAGVIAGAGIGAAVGGLTAKFVDAGIPDSRLRELGDALKPNTSAIVAVLELVWIEQVQAELQRQGADVMTQALKDDISAQLAQGKDVAYTAVAAGGVAAVARETSDGKTTDIAGAIADADGVTVGEAEIKDIPPPAATDAAKPADAGASAANPA
jgi:uncharacterized membrane protein